jgi:hypothetical protein
MKIITGKLYPPERIVVYGPSGCGKSSFACGVDWPASAPRADVLALDYENGLDQIGASRVRGGATWDESMALMREASTGAGDHKCIVIDTIDRLEDQATKLVCQEGKKKSLADFGFGDGYEALVTKWREMLFLLESAREKQRAVILLAHVQQRPQDDPTIGKYDKYVAALQKRCWGATHRWADAVLFVDYERGLVDGRAVMTGQRNLYAVAGSGFDAKNRWGLPAAMPLSWGIFAKEKARRLRESQEIIDAIRALAKGDDAAKAEEFLKSAGTDVARLCSIETALLKKAG